jgi:hypothetical protein
MIWGLMIAEGNKQKRQNQMTLPSFFENWMSIYFLMNFFLPYPNSPSKPEPRRSMVAGSGTTVGSGIVVVSNTGIIGVSKETGKAVTGGSGVEATRPPSPPLSSRHPINRRSTIRAITEAFIKFFISFCLLSFIFEKEVLNKLFF